MLIPFITRKKRLPDDIRPSADKPARVFAALPDPVVVTRLTDGLIVEINAAFTEVFGYAAVAAVGRTLPDLKLLQDDVHGPTFVRRLQAGETVSDMGFWSVCRDGQRRYFFVSARAFKLDGEDCVIATLRDGTDQKAMVDVLRESEERYRLLVESLPDGILIHQDGQVTFVNPAAARLFGAASASELIGRHVPDFLHPDYRDQAMEQRDLPPSGSLLPVLEQRLMRLDGSSFYADVHGAVYTDRGRQLSQVIVRDITERRTAEEDLRRSETTHRELFHANPIPVWVYERANLRFLAVNDAAIRQYGYTRAEFLSMSLGDLIPRGAALLAPSAKTTLYRRKDGTLADVEIASHDIEFEGQAACLVLAHDVTAQMRTQQALRKLSMAVEQSPVAILITDRDGRVEYVNPKFTQGSGYTLNDMLGRNADLLRSGEHPTEEAIPMWQSLRSGKQWSGELHCRHKDGSTYWEHGHITPLLDVDGTITHFVAIKEDITERKQTEEHERQRQSQLLHSARLITMGEMASAIAHELNQPLTAISNFSSVGLRRLEGQADPAKLQDLFGIIGQQALRAGEIIHGMRDFVKKRDPDRQPLNVNDVVGELAHLASIQGKASEVAIELDLDPQLPLVRADRIQIEQVLFNLIKNGIEAMEGTSSGRRIRISTRQLCPAEVEVSVADHGGGLPDPIGADIFAPFFTTKPEGMGMGLSISRSILEAHGGRLWAVPNSGGGTIFHFSLPVADEVQV